MMTPFSWFALTVLYAGAAQSPEHAQLETPFASSLQEKKGEREPEQPTPPAADPQTAGELEPLPDLKPVIDRAVRWLRGQQNLETGRYGDTVYETAWVLRCFATSPRRYRRQDGPWIGRALDYLEGLQHEDGSIHDEHVGPEDVYTQSFWCLNAFSEFEDEKTQAMVAKLMDFLKVDALGPPAPYSQEEAESFARGALENRKPGGYWENDNGKVLATATVVDNLSRAYATLQPKKAGPRPIQRLPRFEAADRESALAAIRRGAGFLLEQADQGRWGPPGHPEPGLSAMVLGALLCVPEPRPRELQQALDEGLAWLASLQKNDGSIHAGQLANYTTSAAVLALARSGDKRYAPVIERARRFLVKLQADGKEGFSEGDLYFGGIGYGGDERPDLSNLQMALEALRASGLEENDPTFQRALKFLQRTQNRSESNDAEVNDTGGGAGKIVPGDDGGAGYMPGNSPAGYIELADGRKVPRSYGSMTYALLKGYIFAGLAKDDPRMQAAWKWLKQNYTLDVNPGFEYAANPMAAYQGLFYYFLTMAQALDLYGEEEIEGPEGVAHAWRNELCGRLVAMQHPETGAWVNENAPRWWEGNPVLATAYALLALDRALPAAR